MRPLLVEKQGSRHSGTAENGDLPPAILRNTQAVSSEQAQVVRGSSYTLTARLVMAASRGIALILISTTLGAARFGDYSLLIAAFAISSSLGTFGLDQAYTHFTGSKKQASLLMLRNAAWMAVVFGFVAGCGLLLSVHLLRARIFDTTPLSAVYLTVLVLPGIVFHNYLQGMTVGRSWFRYHGIVEVCRWSLHLVFLAAMVALNWLTIGSALLGLYLPTLLVGVVHMEALRRTERLSYKSLLGRPILSLALQTLSYGARACLLHATQVLHLRLDVYLVKYFTSSTLVGQYALAINVADVILYGGRSVGLVVLARRSTNPISSAGVTPMVTRAMLIAVGCIATGVFMARDLLVGTFFGAAFLASTGAIACRLPGIVAESLSIVIVSDFLGRAKTRGPLIMNTMAVCVGFALNIFLIPIGGIVAAASVFSLASWIRVGGLVGFHANLTGCAWQDYMLRWRRRRLGGDHG